MKYKAKHYVMVQRITFRTFMSVCEPWNCLTFFRNSLAFAKSFVYSFFKGNKKKEKVEKTFKPNRQFHQKFPFVFAKSYCYIFFYFF